MLNRLKPFLFAALAVALFACAAPPAQAQNLFLNTLPVKVCDPTVAANCIKPNADGSIATAAGGTVSYSTTDKGGTITTGGSAQSAIASNASRKIWCIQNDPSASEVLNVRLNGTASATTGIPLQAGQQACSSPGALDTAAVSVFAATTGHRWFGFEGQ